MIERVMADTIDIPDCPVCGAEEHPWKGGVVDALVAEQDARVAALRERLALPGEDQTVELGRGTVTLDKDELSELVDECRERTRSYQGARERFRERLAAGPPRTKLPRRPSPTISPRRAASA